MVVLRRGAREERERIGRELVQARDGGIAAGSHPTR